ncbi:copper amine oxidase N-terminal domain-containing protein [Paenalkalicoccus suaedae]|uniref:Copper amine oxidase N-terminal domain-containing protein n=1 Tax=Paenalkalicoccus suaedae TaxID=2592382 RepID=A0A859FH38_9BACI|nr:copper amine oxidase N-terminal domain-containing protein [Paenalkalicoccus suaedae]QKS72683.1 copper amine oxidase N-terminal domain-containing protein [Paenalkalicoccus suaedae]
MGKRLFAVVSFVLIVVAFWSINTVSASAASVVIDNQVQRYDQPPVIMNNRTMVPMRGIFESLGATVEWDSRTRIIVGRKGPNQIVLQVGRNEAIINGRTVRLEAPPIVTSNGRTLVPLRFIGETLGASVNWQSSNRTAYITRRGNIQVLNRFVDDGYYHVTNFNDGTRVVVTEGGLAGGTDEVEYFFVGIFPADSFQMNQINFSGYSLTSRQMEGQLDFTGTYLGYLESLKLKGPLQLVKGDLHTGGVFFYVNDVVSELYMYTEDRSARIYPGY